ncbi:MAG TPA: ABC transporter substrate-binding protein [Thermoanaerobaculia bacterium]|nr:ABC transporter substrate-binding protein [Thermoanaerobaculia bacterium]
MALLAGAAPAPPAGEAVPRRIHLKVLYGRYLAFAPHAIAAAEGFFDAEGLDVELVHMTSTADAMPALIRGDIDVGAGLIKVADFNAMARGAALRIVADQGHDESGGCVAAGIVARPGYSAAANDAGGSRLRGARISATPLSYGEFVLETFVTSKGLKLSDLEVSRLPAAAASDAVAAGSIDFTYLAEPFLTAATRSGRAVLWTPLHAVVPRAQRAVILFGPNLLEKNREAGRRFLAAYLRGVRQYNLGKTPRNLEILSKETGLGAETLRESCWTLIHSDGTIDTEGVLDFERWAVRRGVLDAVVPPERFWDPSFAEAAGRNLASRPPVAVPKGR